MIVDSLKFDDFGPQTMYDGIPGIYTLPKGSYITFAEIYKDKESENDVLLVSKPNCVFDNTEGGMA